MRSVVYFIFLASGAAGLIYEVVWMRMLTRILGATVFAYTVVLSAFMLGLALGGWWLGRRIDRRGRPLLTYAALEAGIAAWAIALPFLLGIFVHIFVAAARAFSGAPLAVNLIRWLLAFLAVLAPTILMGGTLPVLSKFVVARSRELGERVGLLYAVNAFGAVLGAGAAGFCLIGRIGELRTTAVAVALNLGAAGVAAALARAAARTAERQSPVEEPDEEAPAIAGGSPRLDAAVLLVAGVTGFTVLAYEVLWTRTGVLLLDNSTYSFSTMLIAFLTGIAVGSAAMAAAFRRWRIGWPARWRLLALFQLLIGLVALISFASPMPAMAFLHPVGKLLADALPGLVNPRLPVVFALLAPLTLVSGATFPLAASLHARELARVGRGVGAVYLSNTIGSALGSAAAGFALLPAFGIAVSFLICVLLNLVCGLAILAALPSASRAQRLRLAAPAVVIAGVCLAVVMVRSHNLDVPRTLLRKRLERPHQRCLFYREDINGIVSVWINPTLDDPWVNNKRLYIDCQPMAAAYRYAMMYERLQAHYPLLLHPDPKDVLVICLGTGTTLGSAGQYPVSRIDCVELSPAVVAAGAWFEEETHDILADERVTVYVDDGRNYLLSTTREYDVITAEPMHPHLAGTVNLYTKEYFELVRGRLRPGGICSHWIPVHRLAPEEVKMAAKAFREAFPHTMMFLETAELIMVGSDRPLEIDASRWGRLLSDPRVSADLEEVGLAGTAELLATYMMHDDGIDRYLGEAAPVVDDLPTLEFFGSWPAFPETQPENIRELLAHRESLDEVRALFAGEPSEEEAAALARLYPLEEVYLRGYADYVSGRYEAARAAFERVVGEAPRDRRAEICLSAARQGLGDRGAAGGATAPDTIRR